MSDLVEFLRARLDEDEREIRLALQPDEPSPQLLTSHRAFHLVLTHELGDSWPTGSPRMFADVEAKRDLISLYQEAETVIGKGTVAVMAAAVARRDILYRVVATFAAVYADHPDYREEWKP
jgi:hypothetical protein